MFVFFFYSSLISELAHVGWKAQTKPLSIVFEIESVPIPWPIPSSSTLWSVYRTKHPITFSAVPSVPANHQVCLRTDVKATRGQKTRSKQTPLYLLRTRWIINFHFCGVLVVGGGQNGGWFLPSRDNMESMALSAMSRIGRPRIYSILIATICWALSYPTRPTVYPSYPAESRVWRDVVVLGYLLR